MSEGRGIDSQVVMKPHPPVPQRPVRAPDRWPTGMASLGWRAFGLVVREAEEDEGRWRSGGHSPPSSARQHGIPQKGGSEGLGPAPRADRRARATAAGCPTSPATAPCRRPAPFPPLSRARGPSAGLVAGSSRSLQKGQERSVGRGGSTGPLPVYGNARLGDSPRWTPQFGGWRGRRPLSRGAGSRRSGLLMAAPARSGCRRRRRGRAGGRGRARSPTLRGPLRRGLG